MDSYQTVEKSAAAEFVEKRSRFIGTAAPVQNEQQALNFIGGLRSKYWDATHNVYAYSIRDGQIRRFSDDSEPQGTAGMPTLDVLQKENVTDCAVVITRYFGGIMLGAGGLVRAYSHAAKIALDAAGIITMKRSVACLLFCEYNQYGRVNATLIACGAAVENALFQDKVKIEFLLSTDDTERCAQMLRDATGGTVNFEILAEKYAREK